MSKKKLIYRINKIIRIVLFTSLSIFSVIMLSFIIIASFLDYSIPEIETIELYDQNNEKFLSYSNGKKKSYISLDKISPYTIDAFISIEDKRFFNHTGLDFIRICKAAFIDIIKKDTLEGASTITQQYARNLFLTTDKTWKRKLSEMMIALNIESKYSKEEILEGYLNSIYFDSGIYGIEDASIFYFGKSASDLTLLESVSLAAIPKGPRIYSPIKNPENNEKRRLLILKEMLNDEMISNEEYQNALIEELTFTGYNPNVKNTAAPFFQDYILNEIKRIPNIKQYAYKGLKVYTTLDSSLNNIINESIANRIDNDLQTSIVVINPKNGAILSLIGGTNYEKSSYNRAIGSYRQPGSTIKPFLYHTALENGFNVSTTFQSEKTTFYYQGHEYTPHNFLNIYPNREVSMAYALATSDNIYAVKTHLFLGPNKLKEKLEKLKISGNIPSIPSLCLGTYEVTNYEWARAYLMLASGGKTIEPYGFTKITTFDDEIIYKKETIFRQNYDYSTIYILNEAMTNIFDGGLTVNIRPTGMAIANRLTHKYAAKSGSTDTDYWMVGYNPDLLVSVWTGYDDNRKITLKKDSLAAKYIWADIMEKYFENKNTNWYQCPNDVIGVNLNPITGFYSSFNEYNKTMYFKENNIPWYLNLLNLY